MHASAMTFACSALTAGDVTGKRVIEAGALNVNGSVRPHVESLGPSVYVGTDMRDGPGVDLAIAAEDLPAYQAWPGGDAGFEVMVSTEMLEHAPDWQAAMRGMIEVLRPGGILVLTTRSEGFPLHGYPDDHWRFSVDAMGAIVKAAGLDIERLEADSGPGHPGVFVKARKPQGWAWPDVREAWESAGVTAVAG
jgi:SAM-dependent methyltransferase